MRPIRRAAVIRAFLGILASILGVNCTLPDARADDGSVRTIEAPSPSHRFGDRGDLVIPVLGARSTAYGFGGEVGGFSFSEGRTSAGATQSSNASVAFAPSLDLFVARHFSLGLTGGVAYTHMAFGSSLGSTDETKTLTASFIPRVGYAFPVGDHFAVWPRVAFGLDTVDVIQSDPNLVTGSNVPFTAHGSFDVDLVYVVDRRLFVAVDPALVVVAAPEQMQYPAQHEVGFDSSLEIGFVL